LKKALLAHSKLALEIILFSSNCELWKEERRRKVTTLPGPSWLDCGEGSAAGNVVVCGYPLEQIGLPTRSAVRGQNVWEVSKRYIAKIQMV